LKLRFTPRAVENIAAIADYLRARNPVAARKVRASIYDGLRHLVMFPRIGRPQKEKAVRKFVTQPYAYLLYYTLDDAAEEIIVLAVKHPAQERPSEDS